MWPTRMSTSGLWAHTSFERNKDYVTKSRTITSRYSRQCVQGRKQGKRSNSVIGILIHHYLLAGEIRQRNEWGEVKYPPRRVLECWWDEKELGEDTVNWLHELHLTLRYFIFDNLISYELYNHQHKAPQNSNRFNKYLLHRMYTINVKARSKNTYDTSHSE